MTGKLIDIVSPLKKLRMAQEAAVAAHDLEKLKKLQAEEKKLKEEYQKAKKALEDGKKGVRVTAPEKFQVPCFDKKGKHKDPKKSAEYDRQLKMQEDALNRMSPDDYLKARGAFDPSNRLPAVQQAARKQWIGNRTSELVDSGLSKTAAGAQAASEAKSLAALHELDMIAGGDPANVKGMGSASANSSIGSSWKSRVDALDKNAKEAKAAGQKLMNVKLKRC